MRVVATLNQRQEHRGPDDRVEIQAGAYCIGNTRLAIQDPGPAGNQPFYSSDGRYVAVFNGEIYNYVELFEQFGIRAHTTCDGALIPELWSRMGSDCLSLFRGMYGFAVVDQEENSLWLARDPFGIKPLYYRPLDRGSLFFASEVRPLAEMGQPQRLSKSALVHYLALGSMPADASPFEDIHAVGPGEVVKIQADGDVLSHKTSAPGDGLPAVPGASHDVGIALRESIELHLRSDVPTALLLSGGVDSAAIACVARGLGTELQCLTVAGLGDADEAPVAARTASIYGHPHSVVPSKVDGDTVRDFFASMQRPSIDGLNTFLVSRAIRAAGFKVALSGLGADEALGGYRHYRALPFLRGFNLVARTGLGPMVVRAARRRSENGDKRARLVSDPRISDAWSLDLLQREVFSPSTIQRLSGVDPRSLPSLHAPEHLEGSRSFAALVEAERILYMQSTLLPDSDAFSMASSIELRVPFVDVPFFKASLAARKRRPFVRHKRLLTQALRDERLSELATMPKRGFALPMQHWLMSGVLADLVTETMDVSAPVWGYADHQAGREIHRSWQTSGRWAEIWTLVALNSWLRSLRTPVLST
jgi:asparagine synthase (glutamine-hydrolysing)